MTDDKTIREVFERYRTIAVYGMSKDPNKPAHYVPAHMQTEGYTIIPVNPSAAEIIGIKSYPGLQDIPERIEILNVFRPSEQIEGIVREALERRSYKGDIEVIWLQEGIRDDGAREAAEKAGIVFIQDLCMSKEFRRLFPQ
ncbi:MAG: CoA-binding protein [Syntrophales bacterium LBB04]|nr:CoA-binding protein [Syntrophales bacterium LBB04]